MSSRRGGEHRPALDETADADLVEWSRAGDADAFGELWRRHYPSGIAVARSITSSLDPDDLVQEAYTRIFRSIQRGGGPTGSFRAYLFTSIRNTAAAWGRARRETTLDELDAVPDPHSGEQAANEALDRGLTHQAFRSLPTRWQEVLWYTEIEQMKPAEVAPLLGMKANAVAQLAVRAREGLREAWVQAHLRSVEDGSDCQWTIERLGAHARENLGKRDRAKVDAHLHDCARCAIVAAEATEVSGRLALVLLPLALGTGAAGYAAWLQLGAPVVAVAAMPSAVVQGAVVVGGASGTGGSAGAGGGSTGGVFAGAGAMAGLVAAGVLVAATVAVGAFVLPRALLAQSAETSAAQSENAVAPPLDPDADITGEQPSADSLPTAPPETPPVAPPPVAHEPAPPTDDETAPPVALAPPPVAVAPPEEQTAKPEQPAPPAQPDPTPSETTEPSEPGTTDPDPGDTDQEDTDPGAEDPAPLEIGPDVTRHTDTDNPLHPIIPIYQLTIPISGQAGATVHRHDSGTVEHADEDITLDETGAGTLTATWTYSTIDDILNPPDPFTDAEITLTYADESGDPLELKLDELWASADDS